jgi:hypothetical protein
VLADFFVAFDPDDILSGYTSPESFVDRVLELTVKVMPSRSKRINVMNKTGNIDRRVLLQSICVSFIAALPTCVVRDIPEAQFSRIANNLNDSAFLTASVDASVHEIRLQLIAVSTASNMGDTIRLDFGKRSLKVRFPPFGRSRYYFRCYVEATAIV